MERCPLPASSCPMLPLKVREADGELRALCHDLNGVVGVLDLLECMLSQEAQISKAGAECVEDLSGVLDELKAIGARIRELRQEA